MGNYIVHKGILLDECDFRGAPRMHVSGLADRISDYLAQEFDHVDVIFDEDFDGTNDMPTYALEGIAFERFDTSYIADPDHWLARREWVLPGLGFRQIMRAELKKLEIPHELAVQVLCSPTAEYVEQYLRQAICEQVTQGNYSWAEDLMASLADISTVGLPSIRTAGHFSNSGPSQILDFRNANYGPGTRILAELSFNWGQ